MARSFFRIIAHKPVTKDNMPASIPASMVSAKAGLTAISAKIVPPAGTDSYSEFVNDDPIRNKSGIVTIKAIDHLPDCVFGTKDQV